MPAAKPTARSRFRDRGDAGRALAAELGRFRAREPVVIALPRGGVPVGFEVATELGVPLDIALVRKLGAPSQPELGIGALGESGEAIIDTETIRRLGVSRAELERVVAAERRELERRRDAYRANRPPIEVEGRVVILVDDGLATGVTAVAAARVLRAGGAEAVILAVPICPVGVAARLRSEFDDFICLRSPEPFLGVGGGYDDFSQTSDGEVVELLERAGRRGLDREGTPGGHPEPSDEVEVRIPAPAGVELAGTLSVPEHPRGLVIFAHGSGSSRLSPRNRAVAASLNADGFATLLFDLLSDAEAGHRENVFDIDLLATRLQAADRWVQAQPELAGLGVGLFGASTGAAAALRAAAATPSRFAAVVSRGGRPDLAGRALAEVVSPTLLVVGGEDREVLALNRAAAQVIAGECEVTVVPEAGHLFEEPGTLERVCELAAAWYAQHLESGAVRDLGGGVD